MNKQLLKYKLSKYEYLLSLDSSNSKLYNQKILYYKKQLGGGYDKSISKQIKEILEEDDKDMDYIDCLYKYKNPELGFEPCRKYKPKPESEKWFYEKPNLGLF